MEVNNFTDFTEKFSCEFCNIKCSRNKEWERHLLTAKHLKRASGSNLAEKNITGKEYKCICEKIYKTHSGLWKHQKLCTIEHITQANEPPSESEVKVLTNLVVELVKSNSDLQKQVLDIFQKIQPGTINNTTNNTHTN